MAIGYLIAMDYPMAVRISWGLAMVRPMAIGDPVTIGYAFPVVEMGYGSG